MPCTPKPCSLVFSKLSGLPTMIQSLAIAHLRAGCVRTHPRATGLRTGAGHDQRRSAGAAWPALLGAPTVPGEQSGHREGSRPTANLSRGRRRADGAVWALTAGPAAEPGLGADRD